MSIISDIQTEVYGRLLSADYFADVPVLLKSAGVMESDIAIRLGVLTSGGTGKLGAVVIVSMPSLDVPNEGVAGPQFDILLAVRVLSKPLLNASASGIGKTAEELVEKVLWLIHNFMPYGIGNNIVADKQAVTPIAEFVATGVVGYDVFFRSRAGIASGNQVALPQIMSAAGLVTIACGTAGAEIYYTLDDSYPQPAMSTLYTAPVVVGYAYNVRAGAYKPGMKPSDPAFAAV